MKAFISEIRGAVTGTVALAVVCCGIYPLVVFGISQALFRDKANGSLLLDKDGTIQGSRLIGQNFTADKYFHPRPSAAGNGYDAANSGGSNFGPTSQKLNDSIKERIETYRKENGLSETNAVPADAVTASASGLDPHISVRNAEMQTVRVARVRGVPVQQIREMVDRYTDGKGLGVLGEPGVNVLLLNLSLDAVAAASGAGG